MNKVIYLRLKTMTRNISIESLESELQSIWQQACQVAAANGAVEFDGDQVSPSGEPTLEYHQLEAVRTLCNKQLVSVNEGMQVLKAVENNLIKILPSVADECQKLRDDYKVALKMNNQEGKHGVQNAFREDAVKVEAKESNKAKMLSTLGVTRESHGAAKSARQAPEVGSEPTKLRSADHDKSEPALDDDKPKGPKGP